MSGQGGLTEKGRETRSRIVDAALSLVTEVGYEEASMRAIAERAGVSVGNAYYYFPSKAQLVRGFYDRTREDLERAVEPILARERTLEARLRGVLWAWFKLLDPHHEAAAALFAAGADPENRMTPFGGDPDRVREDLVALYELIVEGSSSHVPDELRAELPLLLWTAHTGVALFWLHDRSPRRERTAFLIDRAPSLIVRAIALSRLPGVSDLRRQTQEVVRVLLPV